METARANDLKTFLDFADDKLSNGGAIPTLEDALDLWEYENSSPEERDERIRAIQEGLADMHAGRTRDAWEVLEELRKKHNIAAS